MELEVHNQKGKVVDKVTLDQTVFDGKINMALLHQAVVTYLANQRKGQAKAKERGEVRGGGTKPWRQKGTGRARVGSIRSPLWKGGGVVFGPKPRDYSKKMPQRMRVLALKSALNTKLNDNEMVLIDEISLPSHKTKECEAILKKLKLTSDKVRFVVSKLDNNLKLASRNIEKLNVEIADNLTTYTTLGCSKIVFTKESLKQIQERIKKWLK
jgi:large subunit ribosomal protein L4